MADHKTEPNSRLGKAISYLLNHGTKLALFPSTAGKSGYLPCLISEANPRWTQGLKPENGESYQHTRQRPYRQHYGPSKMLDSFKQRQ